MLGLLQGARISDDAYVTDVSLAVDDTGIDVTLVIGTEPGDGVPVEEVKRELYTRLTAHPDDRGPSDPGPATVRRHARPARTRSPGFGWARFSAATLAHPVRAEEGDETAAGGSTGTDSSGGAVR